jgi:hypothetical protein
MRNLGFLAISNAPFIGKIDGISFRFAFALHIQLCEVSEDPGLWM